MFLLQQSCCFMPKFIFIANRLEMWRCYKLFFTNSYFMLIEVYSSSWFFLVQLLCVYHCGFMEHFYEPNSP